MGGAVFALPGGSPGARPLRRSPPDGGEPAGSRGPGGVGGSAVRTGTGLALVRGVSPTGSGASCDSDGEGVRDSSVVVAGGGIAGGGVTGGGATGGGDVACGVGSGLGSSAAGRSGTPENATRRSTP
ncbi:hypothetical protein BB31_30580 [Amycolatopsis lurida NRRL 2430]|uniref:Uncharacterized protein n=1 Tax=Amycolatopsis lurida NRRL 2430 TaxID=1460371 RepID=A0A2P2FLG4_AMYLU|nr:hypothetical protein BB31_30580 [Amycolatopsis lurida NRRL 2430]